MTSRRTFLKGSLALAGAAAVAGQAKAQMMDKFPPALVYTTDAPGRWKGKEGAHAPKVTIDGRNVKIVTPHPMTEKHYIVKHTLITPDGKLFGEKTFANTDTSAESTAMLPEGFKGTVWATSFCNLHDMWITVVVI